MPSQDHSIEDLERVIRSILRELLSELYAKGIRNFIAGGALGFDMIAASEVVAMRGEHSDIRLILAIPFEGQQSNYPSAQRDIYEQLRAECDHAEIICAEYNSAAYHLRNDFMVQNCCCLVTFNNGEGRGTLSTIRRARKLGVEVLDIREKIFGPTPYTQLDLQF